MRTEVLFSGRVVLAGFKREGAVTPMGEGDAGGAIVFSHKLSQKGEETTLFSRIKGSVERWIGSALAKLQFNQKVQNALRSSEGVVGYSIGKVAGGWLNPSTGQFEQEPSYVIEILNVPIDILVNVAENIRDEFGQMEVLVKDYSQSAPQYFRVHEDEPVAEGVIASVKTATKCPQCGRQLGAQPFEGWNYCLFCDKPVREPETPEQQDKDVLGAKELFNDDYLSKLASWWGLTEDDVKTCSASFREFIAQIEPTLKLYMKDKHG